MKHDPSCKYCARNAELDEILVEIAVLEVSTLYLMKDQALKGRCIVAHREHTKELFDLEQPEFEAFMRDVARAAKAVNDAMNPDKINYGSFGDKMPHLHFHIVPKYKDGYLWGAVYELNAEKKVFLSDEEFKKVGDTIVSHL